jgi:hypothetical protein
MNALAIASLVSSKMSELTKMEPSGIKGVAKEKEGWKVTIEMVEKKSIPDGMDILGLYEVWVDEKGEILGFERKKLRKRMDTGEV